MKLKLTYTSFSFLLFEKASNAIHESPVFAMVLVSSVERKDRMRKIIRC